jgi:aminoglycoside phosphotransferase (APT) family kinase protein
MNSLMMEPDESALAQRVASALRARWPQVTVSRLERLQGGASGLTYRAVLSCAPVTEVVVKMAPPGLAPVRNRDVLRQARLLTALRPHADVRVPAVYACDRGDPPGCPPLFVMSFEHGASDEPLHSAGDVPSADVRARGLRAATMLAALHRIPVPGLDEPAVSARHEVERWARALETVPAHLRVGAPETIAGLLSALPPEREPAVCHGDWRLGNMLCVGAEIVAVIDWEIWSVGDPRADLAWFLLMCDPSHPGAIAGTEAGLPPVSELVLAYAAAVGGSVPGLSWFRALAAFKQAATTALLAKHAAQRDLPMEKVTARLAELLPDLQEFARGFLEQKDGGS